MKELHDLFVNEGVGGILLGIVIVGIIISFVKMFIFGSDDD